MARGNNAGDARHFGGHGGIDCRRLIMKMDDVRVHFFEEAEEISRRVRQVPAHIWVNRETFSAQLFAQRAKRRNR